MQIQQSLLENWQLADPCRGERELQLIQKHVPDSWFEPLCQALSDHLPGCSSPDMALNNLERLLSHPNGAERIAWLLAEEREENARSLKILLQLFSSSHSFSDLLIAHPDFLDMIRVPLQSTPNAEELQQELLAQIDGAFEDSAVLRAFRHFRQRHILRIGTNDIIRARSLEEITEHISLLADVSLECALRTSLNKISSQFGVPKTRDGAPARCVILSFGKHGGQELNYSSDIDIMLIYDHEGSTTGATRRSIENSDFYRRVVSELVRLLSDHTESGIAYRVDLRLRPEGGRGPLARSLASTLSYYDTFGRTWERQALIKARPSAGDKELGEEFLQTIEPFIYRRYLNFAEINGIKALKRKIEQRTIEAGEDLTEVKTGRGGIRDIEFVVQFLQLLNGGDLVEVRQRNTLKAIDALEKVGCLNHDEAETFRTSYRFLRKTEHRLQLLFDLQTHRLPSDPGDLRLLARRMAADLPGFSVSETGETVHVALQQRRPDEIPPKPGTDEGPQNPEDVFMSVYREKTEKTRQILDHLLHQTFKGEEAQPETDLILDPDPDQETIHQVLSRYNFQDEKTAYKHLMQLARESVRFLSDRRCRHFLASIAPELLRTVANTPDPDMTLVNLEQVTASLGAKSVLWELFENHDASLKLYVELCAGSQFLSEILIKNPGMIDELLDTLVLDQPGTAAELRNDLRELCAGVQMKPAKKAFGEQRRKNQTQSDADTTSNLDTILHSFQATELLRIGVRDLLGKSSVRETSQALSDLAETLLEQIVELQYPAIERKLGRPVVRENEKTLRQSHFVLLAMGKLGGHELSYHSDLDLVLVYEADGQTEPLEGATRFDRFELTSNVHFFTELAQRIIRMTSHPGPMGRLYEIDMRLRPTGRSGTLAIPLAEFQRYYLQGQAQFWERQALTKARVVLGEEGFAKTVTDVVRACTYDSEWKPENAEEILEMRQRLEESVPARNLKRGRGGLVDVEFLVQAFQLRHGREVEALREAKNVWEGLAAMHKADLISEEEQEELSSTYEFLLRAQSRLRIVHNRSLNEVPEEPAEIEKLARRLGYEDTEEKSAADVFLSEWDTRSRRTRELFLNLLRR